MLAFLEQVEDFGGVFPLGSFAGCSDDLEIGLICAIGSALGA